MDIITIKSIKFFKIFKSFSLSINLSTQINIYTKSFIFFAVSTFPFITLIISFIKFSETFEFFNILSIILLKIFEKNGFIFSFSFSNLIFFNNIINVKPKCFSFIFSVKFDSISII